MLTEIIPLTQGTAMIGSSHRLGSVIVVFGLVGVAAHIVGSSGVPPFWQYVFGGASVLAALAILVTLGVWVRRWWRTHYRAWDIDYTDPDLIDGLGRTRTIRVDEETEVFVRIRVNVFRPISFEEIAVHPRKSFTQPCVRRWLYNLQKESIGDAIRIIGLRDPEEALYLESGPKEPWVRKFITVPSRDDRGIWRGVFVPPYIRARSEPLYVCVRLLATKPWKGRLFVRLMNDNERAFHPLELEAVEDE